jgi:hypothetical protein
LQVLPLEPFVVAGLGDSGDAAGAGNIATQLFNDEIFLFWL